MKILRSQLHPLYWFFQALWRSRHSGACRTLSVFDLTGAVKRFGLPQKVLEEVSVASEVRANGFGCFESLLSEMGVTIEDDKMTLEEMREAYTLIQGHTLACRQGLPKSGQILVIWQNGFGKLFRSLSEVRELFPLREGNFVSYDELAAIYG